MSEEISIINDDKQDYIPVPFPGSEGVYFKILKADEKANRVVLKFKFEGGSKLPRHIHHCRAVAYTIAGEWEYDEGSFQVGHVAYEHEGNDHTAFSNTGAELFIFFDSDSDLFLDNFLECGTRIRLRMDFFKAFEGLNLSQLEGLSIENLAEITPPEDAQAG